MAGNRDDDPASASGSGEPPPDEPLVRSEPGVDPIVERPEQGAPEPSLPPLEEADPEPSPMRNLAVTLIGIALVAGLVFAARSAGFEDPAPAALRAAPTSPGVPPAGAFGAIVVSSTPDGAALFIDGVERGTTPARVERVDAGDHIVRLVREGHRQWTSGRVTVQAGETLQLRVPLESVNDGDK